MKRALNILVAHHSVYGTILQLQPSVPEEEDTICNLTCSEDRSHAMPLKDAESLEHLEEIYKSLWQSGDRADEEDVLVVNTRDSDYQYHPSFMINWKAMIPMGKLLIVFKSFLRCLYCFSLLHG